MLSQNQPIGELLVAKGLLTVERLEKALSVQKSWHVRFGDILLALGYVRPRDLYSTLAERFTLPFVDLMAEPPEDGLAVAEDADTYADLLVLPWRRDGEAVVVATADPGPRTLQFARSRFGPKVRMVVTSKFDILWTLQRTFETEYSHEAVYGLAEIDPENSAKTVITPQQGVFFYLMVSVLLLGLALAPVATAIALNLVMGLFYLGNFFLKLTLVWFGSDTTYVDRKVTDAEVRALKDEDLPVFTILVPMYKEPEVLPILAAALRRLDYPLAKLDIKLVLEAGDRDTIDAAKSLGLEGVFEIIRVPASKPQTKPKACNYALHFSRGDFLVIFDAEDQPEPDQLKKVIVAFNKAGPKTACIQCRLNYFNAGENWLTRMFTLDYSLWFDFMLPGLERLRIPIPLGGTSNHFRMDVLRNLRAWDPFNVTEDADLGVRLTQKGYRVGVVNSTTFEEANCSIPNWIRQRSRWIKGYMQTYLVHMRHPLRLYKSIGHAGFWGFQFFIGGTMLSGILNPLFWAFYALWLVVGGDWLDPVFPPVLLYLSLINLILGNGLFTYLSILAPVKRGWMTLAPWGLTVAGYWALMSVAAYKGLWQLIRNPFYWEKTQHGLSKVAQQEVAKALASVGK
ncbi:glycosyltransferase family 2 protein [Nitrospirillum sp. BR 11164]|uniref:glycosyltransferase family 2 protein n=1 Tax=Nitrospirillum sp. BR 11164 TaxID=3104324 RepID=UPI002AFFCC7A|nr:glycosyltransferase family 2 protein [Nitrospirillum sp. BR 11164]MEA1652377.1 glycosyltransferase family 2 protein [Nitrospirillum sp. BR 11164]